MAEPSRDEFVEQVLTVIRETFPLVDAATGDVPFSVRINGHSVSLENIFRITTGRPAESKRSIERWVVELLRAAEGSPDRTGSFDELKDRILPMVLGPDGSESPDDVDVENPDLEDLQRGIITQPLVGGLRVGYAIDADRTIQYIQPAHFQTWNLTRDELHEVAIANLVKRSESMNAHAAQDEEGQISLILFQAMDGYDASRILLPTLHERLREHLGSPFAAAIPNRDILLCFRNDPATVARLQAQVAQDFSAMPHPVTDRLLLVTADGLAPRE